MYNRSVWTSFRILHRLALLPFLLALAGCDDSSHQASPDTFELRGRGPIQWQPLTKKVETPAGPLFESLAPSKTGIGFRHAGIPPEKQSQIIYASGTSGGVCIGDYDADGLADLFLTQPFGLSRLYRNRGQFRFEDVTVPAGVENRELWGMGATFVDIDNDSDLDLYICAYDGPNRLLSTNGTARLRNKPSSSAWISTALAS